jgi:multidrug efflux pump
MNLSKFFIDRPIFAAVLSMLIFLAGCSRSGPCRSPNTPRSSRRRWSCARNIPAPSPRVIAETVATPIEEQINGVEGMLYMSSQATTDGVMTLNVTFRLGTDPDKAQQLVQNRVSQAEPRLPEEVRRSASPRSRARPT